MNIKMMSLGVLFVSAACAFAFKAEARKGAVNNVFQLSAGGNENNPFDYTPSTWSACSGTGNICKIDVLNGDLYSAIEAAAEGDAALEGLPKVKAGTTLATQITAAKAATTQDPVTISSRVYEKRP